MTKRRTVYKKKEIGGQGRTKKVVTTPRKRVTKTTNKATRTKTKTVTRKKR